MQMLRTESKNLVRPPGRKRNFLLIDDDEICIFIHRRVLELSNYCHSVHSAGNGKTALELLKQAGHGPMPVPDIILLDMEMPVMNGLEFLEAFQTFQCVNKEQIAIVLLTSSVSSKDLDYARSLGVTHCLSKPLTQHLLDETIARLSDSISTP